MSETLRRVLTARPTFEQDTPASVQRPASGSFGLPPVGGRSLISPSQAPITGTQTSQVQGAPYALSAIADFLTAFGAGVPAAQQQQAARRQGVQSLLDREMQKAVLGTQQGQQGFENRLAERRTLLDERAQKRLEESATAQAEHQKMMEKIANVQAIELNDDSIALIDKSGGTVKRVGSGGDLDDFLKDTGLAFKPDELGQLKAAFKAGGLKSVNTALNAIMDDRRGLLRAREGRAQQTVVIQTVDEKGNPVQRIVPKTPGSEFAAPPTADMRNKEAARNRLIPAIDGLEKLSQRVITEKSAAVQKAKAAGRTVEAALANDPDFRTYQDARMALAGNLAVAQQGSRPSDADIKAIWLPLVPDVFKDTQDSARMKWELIRLNSGLSGGAGGGKPRVLVEGKDF